jgi:hypothetical protein
MRIGVGSDRGSSTQRSCRDPGILARPADSQLMDIQVRTLRNQYSEEWHGAFDHIMKLSQ